MKRTICRVALGVTLAAAAVGAGAAPALADPSNANPQGCGGAGTVGYKQYTGDPGSTGSAIGGPGGQAHQDPGRGEQVQQFLANCPTPIGSQR